MSQPSPSCLSDTHCQPFRLPAESASGCFLVRIYPPGNLAENLINLVEGDTTIGRDPECDVEVYDDFISRHHLTLKLEEGECWAIDQGSRNGTFINDHRIEQQLLQAGDHLRIGNHVFKFLSADHPETQYHEAVYEMMTSDGLTQIANRRYFEDSFKRELGKCLRHSRPLSVMLLDVDHFKHINDLYGHLIGDECLKELCTRVRAVIREDDLFARIGGEEFAVVLSEVGAADCRRVADRIREGVAAAPFGNARMLSIDLTISIGVAHSDGSSLRTTEEFLADADARLYEAKRSGRNRVVGPLSSDTTPLPVNRPMVADFRPPAAK